MSVSELWAVTVALPHEFKGILPKLSVQAKTQYGAIHVYEGRFRNKSCLMVQTGMGLESAEAAAKFLLNEYPVTHLVSTGYCGALQEGINTGDAIIGTKLGLAQNDSQVIATDEPLNERAKEILAKQKVNFFTGLLLSSPKAITRVNDKGKLNQATGALGVDMESYPILSAASKRQNIASLAVRFVVDGLKDDLSATEDIIDTPEGLNSWKLTKELFRKPKIFLKLPGLERKANKARHHLTKFVTEILS